MSLGLFGDLFDFNGDGKLDWVEQAMEFQFIDSLMKDDEDEDDDEEDDFMDELEMNGIDSVEFEFMDDDERREALEEAGLDPDDYDFY